MRFQVGELYSRQQVHDGLGGALQDYLPTRNGEIVAGCFQPELNPGAPEEVYPGSGPRIMSKAIYAAGRKIEIPVFLKRGDKTYEFVGRYRCTHLKRDSEAIASANAKSGRKDVSGVLHFQKLDPA